MTKKQVTIIQCDRQGCKAQEEIPSEKRMIGGYRMMDYPEHWMSIGNNGNTNFVCPSCAKKYAEITNKFMVENKN
jgi:hypothetical protein